MTPSATMDEVTRLIETYGNDVYRTIFVILRSKELAEDVYQETFLRVCRSFDKYRGEASEKTWIIGIAVNLCRDYMRSAWKKKVTVTDEFPTLADHDDTESIIEKRSERTELVKAIMQLPEKYRKIIHLYYYQEMDINTIAKILIALTSK